jgi:hypothetical protein
MKTRWTLGLTAVAVVLMTALVMLNAGQDEADRRPAEPSVGGPDAAAVLPSSRSSTEPSAPHGDKREARAASPSDLPPSAGDEVRFDCAPAMRPWTETDMEAARTEDEALRARWLELLLPTEDPDLRFAAALLLDEEDPERLEVLWSAVEAGDERPLTLHRLLTTCLAQPAAPRCTDEKLVARAIAADPHNGAMWLAAAALRLSRNDPQAAREAMERAAAASTHREYFVDAVLAREQGLAATSELDYSERVVFAIALEATTPIPFTRLSRACDERAETNPLWRGTCAELGRSAARRAHTLLGRLLGLGLQWTAAKADGDAAESAAISEKLSALRALTRDDRRTEAETVLRYDDGVARAYVAEWRTRGEAAALSYIIREVERLKRIPGYDPCRDKTSARGQ